MASINRVTLLGNVGRDPESRSTQSGQTVTNFTVATSESWKDKTTGERKERTEWHKVVAWGKLAEMARDYLRKGSKCLAEGQLQTRKWTDQSGHDKYSTEVVLHGFDAKLVLLDGKKQNGTSGAPQQHAPMPDFDDDIPF